MTPTGFGLLLEGDDVPETIRAEDHVAAMRASLEQLAGFVAAG